MPAPKSKVKIKRTKEQKIVDAISRAYFDNLDEITFPKQKELILSKSKQKAVVCGRRSGKTTSAIIALLRKCLSKPRQRCCYVSLTKSHAVELIWDAMKHFVSDFNLGSDVRFMEENKEVYFENGSKIMLFGSDTEQDYAKLRGNDIHLGIVDEAQHNKYLKEILFSTLIPCCWKVDGEVWVMGSPSIINRGVWYDLFHGTNTENAMNDASSFSKVYKQFEKFSWNLKANSPALLDKYENYPEELKNKFSKYEGNELLKKLGDYELHQIAKDIFGGDINNTTFKREYVGQWVEESFSFLYDYKEGRNTYFELPNSHFNYIIALDIGGSGMSGVGTSDAIVIVGWENNGSHLYLIEEHKLKIDIVECGQLLKTLYEKFKPVHLIADTGGGGAKAVLTITNLTNLNIEPVIKNTSRVAGAKQMEIDRFNSYMRRGLILVPRKAEIINEWTTIKKSFNDRVAMKWAKVEQKENDLSDAMLYAFNKAVPYLKQIQFEPRSQEFAEHAGAKDPTLRAWEERERIGRAQRKVEDYGWLLNLEGGREIVGLDDDEAF